MTQRLTVSVVIATYNRAAMLRQALHAALAQTRPPDEIVVLDDASSDATAETLAELAVACPSLRVFRRATNSGGIAAWNEAAAHARGDCIAFCADDDRFLREHLEASLAYLQEHPATGVVHSGFIDAVDATGVELFEPRRLRANTPLETTRATLLSYMTRYYNWPIHPSTLVLRRSVWEGSGGYDPAYALADTDWFVRVVEEFSAVLLPRHGVYNRRHPGNWSNRLGSARMQREIFDIVEGSIARVLSERPLRRALRRAIWRATVRLHLLLTVRARLQTGHADAARAAWRGMLDSTGRRGPVWFTRAGERLIHWSCRGRESAATNPLERCSPL